MRSFPYQTIQQYHERVTIPMQKDKEDVKHLVVRVGAVLIVVLLIAASVRIQTDLRAVSPPHIDMPMIVSQVKRHKYTCLIKRGVS